MFLTPHLPARLSPQRRAWNTPAPLLMRLMLLLAVLAAGAFALLSARPQQIPPAAPRGGVMPPLAAAAAPEAYIDLNISQAVRINPGDDIQFIIDQHPPGTLFYLRTGVYRLQSVTPRDGDIFIGEPNTVLSGAVVLENFIQDGSRWYVDGQTKDLWRVGECRSEAPRCDHAYTLYIDDKPVPQVGTRDAVTVGTWFYDYDADRIYIGDNPMGRVVEVSDANFAFGGSASNVTIRGLIIEKYAGPGQRGAIRGEETTGWTLKNNVIRLNSARGITLGHGMQVISNIVNTNGQIGIAGSGDNILIENNEIAFNNFRDYQAGWEAGATKFVATNGLVVRGNYVHNNAGPGLWTDAYNRNSLYEYNLVVANTSMGIFHEISYDVVIRNNVVKFNAPNLRDWLYGAQILISTSSNGEIYDNQVVVPDTGGHGIIVIEQDRMSTDYGRILGRNNHVYNNEIVFLATGGFTGVGHDVSELAEDFWANGNNTFDSNTYYVTNPEGKYWVWRPAGSLTWPEFQELGPEINGRIVTDIPLEAVLVPTWPLEVAQ